MSVQGEFCVVSFSFIVDEIIQDHALNVLHNMSARLGLQVTWEQTQGGYAHAPSWEVVVYGRSWNDLLKIPLLTHVLSEWN
jgi:hypothetical protein